PDLTRVLLDLHQRARAAPRGDDLVAPAAELADQRRSQRFVVLHEKDGLAAPCGSRARGDLVHPALLALCAGRQVDPEGRPVSHCALDLDATLALTDDAEHHRQTQPGALALGFRGEEWLENALARRRAHAGAVVGHGE